MHPSGDRLSKSSAYRPLVFTSCVTRPPARLIQAGASHKTLQTVLGHRSAAFSLTVYGHLFDSDLDALAERLDERNAEWHATLSKRS